MKRGPQVRLSLDVLEQRLVRRPLMMEPFAAEVSYAAIRERLKLAGGEAVNATSLEAHALVATSREALRGYRGERLFHLHEGVAVIPVSETLIHNLGVDDPWLWFTGYDGLSRKLKAAINDREVRAIWFNIDSPGGEVAGLNSFVREIIAAHDTWGKPIWAFVDEQASSAAYAIAAVCDTVIGPPDCVAGSIGACMLHVEYSRALDQEGVTTTIIRSADRKARGGSTEPLDDATRAKMQADVDEAAETFVHYVSFGRRLPLDQVLATEAERFTGPEALRLGLLDDLLDEDAAWAKLQQELARQ